MLSGRQEHKGGRGERKEVSREGEKKGGEIGRKEGVREETRK